VDDGYTYNVYMFICVCIYTHIHTNRFMFSVTMSCGNRGFAIARQRRGTKCVQQASGPRRFPIQSMNMAQRLKLMSRKFRLHKTMKSVIMLLGGICILCIFKVGVCETRALRTRAAAWSRSSVRLELKCRNVFAFTIIIHR